MARFLSQEWFEELPAEEDERDEPDLIVEVAVSGAPGGDVRYQVVVRGERATVVAREGAFRPAQVQMKSDYATMAGIACGKLSTIDVLSAGRAGFPGTSARFQASSQVSRPWTWCQPRRALRRRTE